MSVPGSRMAAQVLQTHTPKLFAAAVSHAAQLLKKGEVVALPTETVYGLAANAFDPAAVGRIYDVKGRPAHNPTIVHVAEIEMARRCVSKWPPLANKLASAFWPGPLTVVLPRSSSVPDIVTAGGETVGVRWPSHPLIQAVIRECGFPLAAPSANLSNQLSPTNAEHVLKGLGDKIPLIVDGGQSQVGIESTVLDLSVAPPCILRPGMIHEQSLLAVTGELATGAGVSAQILKSPGQLPRHYAPKARLVILSWRDDSDLKEQVLAVIRNMQQSSPHPLTPDTCHIISHTRIPSGTGWAQVSVIPHDPEAFARALYAEMHRGDAAGAELIVIEAVPENAEWNAIRDRLSRAATP